MSDRTQSLLRIRPEIPSAIVHDGMSADEQFQNGTLRPVIKLQNELFIAVFKNYIAKHWLLEKNWVIKQEFHQ